MHPPQQKRHILHRTLLCAILHPGILYWSPDAEPGFPPILAAVASESNPAEATSGPFYPLADTGQSLCYDESSSISCGGTSFPNQDGDVTSPVPRGLRPPQLNDGYPADYITVDQSTGLVWKTCLQGLSGVSCSNGSAQTSDWSAAMASCQALNSANSAAGYAGRTGDCRPLMS